MKSNKFHIYCDGACKGNPGISASGIAVYNNNKPPTLMYGRYNANGTNNTAELNALFKSLEIASKYINQDKDIEIFADSKYAIDCISKWAYTWKEKSWSKKGGAIKNLEIIKKAHFLFDDIKSHIKLSHVKAHSGIEGNELADAMSIYATISKSFAFKEYKYINLEEVFQIQKI